MDEALGLDGSGQIDLDDEFLPQDLRDALAGQPVPSWWKDGGDDRKSVRLLGI